MIKFNKDRQIAGKWSFTNTEDLKCIYESKEISKQLQDEIATEIVENTDNQVLKDWVDEVINCVETLPSFHFPKNERVWNKIRTIISEEDLIKLLKKDPDWLEFV